MKLLTKPNDDVQFVELVNHIISALISGSFPEEIFVMKIDNWFDHKWLKFSGIGRVRFGDFGRDIDTALDPFWQDKITFPPFTPKRVIEEYYFLRDEDDGGYSPSTHAPHIHDRKLAPSCNNLHKRIVDFTDSAILVWFSSNTKANLRGSIMVYEVRGSGIHAWYAGLSKGEGEWRILQTKGIPREQVQSLMKQNVSPQRT
jgi:hypothetical protein